MSTRTVVFIHGNFVNYQTWDNWVARCEARGHTVPGITLEGDANGAPHPDSIACSRKSAGKYAHRLITGGIGHNRPQEAPQAFAEAITAVDGC